jgi:hypothetical protein
VSLRIEGRAERVVGDRSCVLGEGRLIPPRQRLSDREREDRKRSEEPPDASEIGRHRAQLYTGRLFRRQVAAKEGGRAARRREGSAGVVREVKWHRGVALG